MAVKNRFKITKGKPGANASGLATTISGLILPGIAVAGKLVLSTPYKISSTSDLAALGLDAAYDTANQVLVYYHIAEFYRMSAEGTTLYIMVVPQTVTQGDLLEDAGEIYAKRLLIFAEGNIRQLGVAINPTLAYVETLTDGINSDIRAAIPKAALLRTWAEERAMDTTVILEGRKFGGNQVTSIDLRAITVGADIVSYEGVQVVIGQDYDFAHTLIARQQFHAAVGTLLGTLAGIEMQQDEGEVETLNLTDTALLKFITPGLSDHTTIVASSAKLDMLDDKGYVFPIKYVTVTGHRWNGDHVCAPIIIDAEGTMNEHKMSYSRIMNECRRAIYAKLIPKVRTTHKVDATTGKLPLATIKWFEKIGDSALAKVSGISGGKTYVNPDSDLFRAPQKLETSFTAVPYGTVGTISGTITLKTQL